MLAKHPTEKRKRALYILALEAGNSQKASEQTGIPAATLRSWQTREHADEYRRIRQELEDRIDRDLAESMTAEAKRRIDILRETGSKALEALGRGHTKCVSELASADRNFATSLGILSQHNRIIREKPTSVVEHRSYQESLEELRNIGAIEGTAEEIDVLIQDEDAQAPARDATSAPHTRRAQLPAGAS